MTAFSEAAEEYVSYFKEYGMGNGGPFREDRIKVLASVKPHIAGQLRVLLRAINNAPKVDAFNKLNSEEQWVLLTLDAVLERMTAMSGEYLVLKDMDGQKPKEAEIMAKLRQKFNDSTFSQMISGRISV